MKSRSYDGFPEVAPHPASYANTPPDKKLKALGGIANARKELSRTDQQPAVVTAAKDLNVPTDFTNNPVLPSIAEIRQRANQVAQGQLAELPNGPLTPPAERV